jgi:hypothetical protein
MTSEITKTFIKYCEKGDFDNVEYLLIDYPNINIHSYQNSAFKRCCYRGHLEMAKWLLTRFPEINIDTKQQSFWCDSDEDDDDEKYNGNFDPFVECCRIGNIEMANWLKDNFINIKKKLDPLKKKYKYDQDNDDYKNAVGDNHRLNKYYYKNNEDRINKALIYSCKNGQLEITRWILDIYPEISNNNLNNENLFRTSCEKGYLEFAKWLLEKYPAINIYASVEDSFQNKYNAFTESCKNGHLEMTIFLHNLDCNKIFDEYKNIAFFNCCENGKLEVAQWLLSNYPLINIDYNIKRIFDTPYNTFIECCGNGNIEMVVWLQSLDKNITFDKYKEKAFIKSCNNGRLNIAMWLLDKFPTLDIHSNNEEAFRKSCENGHLNIAKWLKDKYPSINVHASGNDGSITMSDNYVAIVRCCSKGYKEIVEWLIDIDPKINDNIKQEAFNNSCEDDNIEIAKLLLDQYPTINIRDNNDFLFFMKCHNKQKKVAKFLSELCDDYKFEYKDKKITGCYIFKNGKKYCRTCDVYYSIKHCCNCSDNGYVQTSCPDNNDECRVSHTKRCPRCRD